GRTRGKASLVEEAQNAVGRLCALCNPMLDAVGVELHAFSVLGQHRVPCANGFDEAAVTRAADVGNDDVVVRTLLGASAGQTNLQRHFFFPLDNCFARGWPWQNGLSYRYSYCFPP